jgi:hypothetical protein
MPSSFTFNIDPDTFTTWTQQQYHRFQDLGLTQTQVDNILSQYWTAFPNKTSTTSYLWLDNYDGTRPNAAASGTYQASNPPTTGKQKAYEMRYDTGNINPTHKYTNVYTN